MSARAVGAWLLVAALVWVCSESGGRAEAPRVYVTARASDPALDQPALEIAALARGALAESEGFGWQAADAIVRGAVGDAQAAQARARAALRKGRLAYVRLDLEAAVRDLEAAWSDWERAIGVLDSPDGPAETVMYLGACQVLLGDAQRAARTFERYHAQFADIAPNPSVFNPEIMRQWEQAGRTVAQRGKGRLEVRVKPRYAEVSIDARVRGAGPRVVEGIAPGEHWVRVAVVGGNGFVARVKVEPGRSTFVDAGALHDNVVLLDLFEHADSPEGAQVLAQQLKVDALGVIEVTQGASPAQLSLTLHAHDARSGHELTSFTLVVGSDLSARIAALREVVAAWLDRVVIDVSQPPALPEASAPPAPRADHHDDRSWARRRWWIWALVGGAVAVGATTAIVLATRDSPEPAPGKSSDSGTLVLEF